MVKRRTGFVFHPWYFATGEHMQFNTGVVEANLSYRRDVLVHPAYQPDPGKHTLAPNLNWTQRTNDSYVSRPALRRHMRVRDTIRASMLYDIPQIGCDALRRTRHDL